MRAGERRFVTLIHGVGLVVPSLLAQPRCLARQVSAAGPVEVVHTSQ